MTAESAQASEGRSCVESSILGRARGRSDRVTAGVGSRCIPGRQHGENRRPLRPLPSSVSTPGLASLTPSRRLAEPSHARSRGRPPNPASRPTTCRRPAEWTPAATKPAVPAPTAHRQRQSAQTRMSHTGSRRRHAPDMQSTRRWRPTSPRAATGSAGAPWTPGSAAPRQHGEPSAPSGGHRSHSSAHAYRWGRWSRKNIRDIAGWWMKYQAQVCAALSTEPAPTQARRKGAPSGSAASPSASQARRRTRVPRWSVRNRLPRCTCPGRRPSPGLRMTVLVAKRAPSRQTCRRRAMPPPYAPIAE